MVRSSCRGRAGFALPVGARPAPTAALRGIRTRPGDACGVGITLGLASAGLSLTRSPGGPAAAVLVIIEGVSTP